MAVCHMGCSSRGGPGSTMTVGWPGTTTPGAVPTGSSTCAPAGIMACLRLAARTDSKVPGSKADWNAGLRAINFLRMLAILASTPSSRPRPRPREATHHLNGHVVGRRSQAAAGDDQVHALLGHEAQLRLDVGW